MQGKNCLQLNFQPGYCEDVNSVLRQTEKKKTLNKLKLLGKQNFDEFLKHCKFENWITRYPWDKNVLENVSKLTNLWFKRTKKFVAVRSEM